MLRLLLEMIRRSGAWGSWDRGKGWSSESLRRENVSKQVALGYVDR